MSRQQRILLATQWRTDSWRVQKTFNFSSETIMKEANKVSESFEQMTGDKEPENKGRVSSSGVLCRKVAVKAIATDLGMISHPYCS